MEELRQVVAQLLVLGIMIYAFLLILGAPFGGPKMANRFAKWLVGLPFRMVARLLFGKKKRRRRRRRR